MKELSIEEKAKRYDEAIEKATALYKAAEPMSGCNVLLETVFPELKESEDERIRKDIIVLVKDWWDRVNKDNISAKEQMIAYLEKQGEQKPADITNKLKEEYQKGWDAAMQQLPKEVDSQIWQIANNSAKTWEESFAILCATQKAYGKGKKDALKEYKTAWSEEDVRKMRAIVTIINSTPQSIICSIDQDRESLCNWLKSPRPHNTWKPSEEQMRALKEVCDEHWELDGLDPLYTLYEYLKKLREE